MIVIVYGYEGSGEGHWQRWLEAELQRQQIPYRFPALSTPQFPEKDVWVSELAETIAAVNDEPVTCVCHSLGCWALDHLLAEHGQMNIQAALMVAPPSPYLLFEAVESFLPPPQRADVWRPLAQRSVLVGSDNDDYTSAEEFAAIGTAIGLPFHLIPGVGHINIDSGHGPWPFAWEWLRDVGAVPPSPR